VPYNTYFHIFEGKRFVYFFFVFERLLQSNKTLHYLLSAWRILCKIFRAHIQADMHTIYFLFLKYNKKILCCSIFFLTDW